MQKLLQKQAVRQGRCGRGLVWGFKPEQEEVDRTRGDLSSRMHSRRYAPGVGMLKNGNSEKHGPGGGGGGGGELQIGSLKGEAREFWDCTITVLCQADNNTERCSDGNAQQ